MSDRMATAGTVEVIRLFGVPVRLHFTFVLLLALLIVTDLGQGPRAAFALFLAGLLASMLLHDLAHAWVASRLRLRTIEIVMLPIGGLARYERPLRPLEELWIALAGPLANLLIAAGIFAYLAASRAPVRIDFGYLLLSVGGDVIQRLAFVNVLLALFNLVPAFPMDGGRVLRALLSLIRPAEEATRTATWIGRMLAISMGLYGLFAPAYIVLVFFAFFIWMGAAQESAAALGRTLTRGIPVRAAMLTDFHRLGHGDTIRHAVSLLLSSAQQDFPVMHGEEVIGLLDRARLLQALGTEGPDAYVAGVMDRDYVALDPSTGLAEVLPLMARRGRCALVMEGSRLVGMLTSDSLSEFLLLRRYGMEPALRPVPRL
jgi:Zn-dependent protease